ncbi:hypothetical protein VQ056_06600 [Paenibacillus sp. JTLBN-2024]
MRLPLPVKRSAQKVEPTGGPYEFREFEAGILHFPDAGEYRIELHAERIEGAYLMQPRQLRLTPAAKSFI